MSNLFDLSEYPEITDTLQKAAIELIEQTEKAGFVNPIIETDVKVDDGRIFKLMFERIDLY